MIWIQKYRLRLLFLAIFLFFMGNFFAHMHDPMRMSWFDRTLLAVASPVQSGVIRLFDGITGAWKKYFYLMEIREESQKLKAQIDSLNLALSRTAEVLSENQRMRELVHMKDNLEQRQVLAARVIAVGTSSVARTVRVNVGKGDGVKVGDAVIAGAGLAGRIAGATDHYAEVQLLVDARSAVDVVIQRSRTNGILRGQGEDDYCNIEHLMRTADIEPGDRVVTSGIGGNFPRGILVGTITKVTSPNVGMFRGAEMDPAVKFQSLEEVLVVTSTTPVLETETKPERGPK